MRKELLLALTLALGCTTAFAALSDNKVSFSSADSDGDGSLTAEEFYGSASDWGTYSDWDTNDDGLIDTDEWDSLGWDYDYDAWDANSDGFLDSGELYDGVYNTYDADKDGQWDEDEWQEASDSGRFNW